MRNLSVEIILSAYPPPQPWSEGERGRVSEGVGWRVVSYRLSLQRERENEEERESEGRERGREGERE